MKLKKTGEKYLIPVVHVVDEKRTFLDLDTIVQCGVKNVILISHSRLNADRLIDLAKTVSIKYPMLWIGINFLDLNEETVFGALAYKKFFPHGLWIDNSMQGVNSAAAARIVAAWKRYKEDGFEGTLFSGVAFKYCRQPADLATTIENMLGQTDVITTSGDGTGHSPSVKKMKLIFEHNIHSLPIAIASGITVENVEDFLPYTDIFIVSSSITDSTDLIMPESLQRLKDKILGFSAAE